MSSVKYNTDSYQGHNVLEISNLIYSYRLSVSILISNKTLYPRLLPGPDLILFALLPVKKHV